MATCEPDCGGLSAPAITLVLVVAIGVAVELAALVGFVIGRVVRRVWSAHAR